jgi:hypothetical protein
MLEHRKLGLERATKLGRRAAASLAENRPVRLGRGRATPRKSDPQHCDGRGEDAQADVLLFILPTEPRALASRPAAVGAGRKRWLAVPRAAWEDRLPMPVGPLPALSLALLVGAVGPRTGHGELVSSSTGSMERGIAAFERGDFEDAARDLATARRVAPDDLELALLLGIADYRLGRTEEAENLLEAATGSEDPETAGAARAFLGLIAEERGDRVRARRLWSSASESPVPELAASALKLLEAREPSPFAVGALLRAGYDSNVALISLTAAPPPGATSSGDAELFGLAALALRPGLGFGFEETVSYRKYALLTAYDQLSSTTGVRWEHPGPDRLSLADAFEVATLGGPLFHLGDTFDAAYRRAIDPDLGVGARYQLRQRKYSLPAYAGYSGWSHSGALELSRGTPETPFELIIGALLLREQTDDPSLSAVGLGGRALARYARSGFFALLAATALERLFDAVPSTTEPPRRDTQLLAEATAGYSLYTELAVVFGGAFVRNLSNRTDFDHQKWTVSLGVELSL